MEEGVDELNERSVRKMTSNAEIFSGTALQKKGRGKKVVQIVKFKKREKKRLFNKEVL